jgi:hypothetical protein
MRPVPTRRWALTAQPCTRVLHATGLYLPAPVHQAHAQDAEAARQAEQEAMTTQTANAAAAVAKHEPATSKPKPKPVQEWTVDDVCAFFSAQKLDEYTAAVAENEVDGNMLQQLAAQKGLDELGIKSKLHVIKIEAGLAKAAEDQTPGAAQGEVQICTCHSCTGTLLTPSASAPRLGSPLPQPGCDGAYPCHIGTRTGLSPATTGVGLSSPLPHLHRDWAHASPLPHLHQDATRAVSSAPAGTGHSCPCHSRPRPTGRGCLPARGAAVARSRPCGPVPYPTPCRGLPHALQPWHPPASTWPRVSARHRLRYLLREPGHPRSALRAAGGAEQPRRHRRGRSQPRSGCSGPSPAPPCAHARLRREAAARRARL